MVEVNPDPNSSPASRQLRISNTKKVRLYDNTRISGTACLRYYYLRHVRHWTTDQKKLPLIFGSCWHDSMDVIWHNIPDLIESKETRRDVIHSAYEAFCNRWVNDGMTPVEELSPDDIDDLSPRIPQVAHEMLYHYVDARMHIFSNPTFKLLHIERPFAVPLDPNDDSLFYVGRIDKEFMFQKNRVLGEHKTSSSYKKNGSFRSDFTDSFTMSAQIDGYLYETRIEHPNERVSVWVDAALVHKTEHDGFMFIPIEHKIERLEAWLYETHHYIRQIEANLAVLEERAKTNSPYLAAFPKNPRFCMNYGKCEFFDLCTAIPNPAKLKEPPLGYKIEKWSPFNEIRLEEIGFTTANTEEPV